MFCLFLPLQEGDNIDWATRVPVRRYGHASAIHEGQVYEFGGFVETELETHGGSDGVGMLLNQGLTVSYLAEGRDGVLCPVWIETV